MVEIRYKDQYEVTNLAGHTISEAREQFRSEFGIPEKSRARLNGSTVKASAEPDTVLNDDDKLTFAVKRARMPFMIGAMLLALAITGGVFAYGFVNASTTISAASVSDTNFADVSTNTTGVSAISWSGFGFFKGALASTYPTHSANGTPIFNVETDTSNYQGDLVVTVSLGNADKLAKIYRVLALQLAMETSSNITVDINESGAADSNDWVMLTLENGSVSMFPGGVAGGDNFTVRVMNGFFITHVYSSGWSGGSKTPQLFAEVAQR
ncbi:MAG: hypothetical protein A2Z05_05995 [Chloroflexi bacterium RBG_16_60_22]|nr:MAG: hypothetical protein A2Z05_05995 [Chloroflexi bacterium RBG_16_60_22]